jgi:DNA polymerase-3 subunit epsilon
VIEDDRVVERRSWLMQPPLNEYSYWNIRVHGIRPEDTEDAPSFTELYEDLWPYLDGQRLIAHNASFDMSVLRGCCKLRGLVVPRADYVCSVNLARRAFPYLPDHKLSTVCDHCGIELRHHDASSDAHGAAMIALQCREAVGAVSVSDAVRLLGVTTRSL